MEIALAKANPTLAKVGSLSASILLPDRVVCFFGSLGRSRKFGFEVIEAGLSGADIGQEIEIVVKEIFILISKTLATATMPYIQSWVTFANLFTLGLCKISSSSAFRPLWVLYFLVI